MTDWTMQSTERDLNRMLGDYLSKKSTCAKDLARRIGCDPRTAEGFRAGRHWPQAKHWLGLVTAFGADLTEAVFHPEKAAERLEREIRDLEQQLAERRAAHERIAGEAVHDRRRPRARRAQAVAPVQDRTAASLKRHRAP